MKYLRLMRISHYIKNFFVFVPLIFSMSFLEIQQNINALLGFLVFSLSASIVYIINDMVDIEKDRQHPKKCKRPLASGEVSIKNAFIVLVLLVILILIITLTMLSYKVLIVLILYIIMNLAYSFKLKNIALVDVLILSLGFIFRIFAGAYSINVVVSEWLLLTTLSLSLFLGFGKRYGEIVKVKTGDTRPVLKQYSKEVLNSFMIITLTLTMVFYALYAIISNTLVKNAVFTVPFVIIGMFRYYMLLISNDVDGDPTDIVLKDHLIQGIVICYLIVIIVLLVG